MVMWEGEEEEETSTETIPLPDWHVGKPVENFLD